MFCVLLSHFVVGSLLVGEAMRRSLNTRHGQLRSVYSGTGCATCWCAIKERERERERGRERERERERERGGRREGERESLHVIGHVVYSINSKTHFTRLTQVSQEHMTWQHDSSHAA